MMLIQQNTVNGQQFQQLGIEIQKIPLYNEFAWWIFFFMSW